VIERQANELLVDWFVAHHLINSSNFARNAAATYDSTVEVEYLDLSIFSILTILLEKMG